MNKSDSILITGGNGVLGIALQKKLIDSGIEFVAPRRDELNLLDTEATEKYITTYSPKVIIHLAAMVMGLGGNMRNQMHSLVYNTTINNNLFRALYKQPPKKIFFASTVASYPFPFKSLPLKEEDFFSGNPHYGEFGYAMAKKHAYSYLKILQKEHGVSFIYGLFTNLFGEHDKFDIDYSHVIPSLIAKAYEAKINNQQLEVWGDGSAERDFLYSKDAAKAILFLLNQNDFLNDIINISSGKTQSIKQVSEIIANSAEIQQGVKFLYNMPTGIPYRSVSNNKISNLGFKVNTNFIDALSSVYSWYVNNNNIIKK